MPTSANIADFVFGKTGANSNLPATRAKTHGAKIAATPAKTPAKLALVALAAAGLSSAASLASAATCDELAANFETSGSIAGTTTTAQTYHNKTICNSTLTNATINSSIVLNSNLTGGKLIGSSLFAHKYSEGDLKINATFSTPSDIGLNGVTFEQGIVFYNYTYFNGTHNVTSPQNDTVTPSVVLFVPNASAQGSVALNNLTLAGADWFVVANVAGGNHANVTISGSVNLQGGASGTWFIGADSENGTARANITLANSSVVGKFIGAESYGGAASANVTFGGSVVGDFEGAYNTNGDAAANVVFNGNVTSLVGAYADYYGDLAGAKVGNAAANLTFSGVAAWEHDNDFAASRHNAWTIIAALSTGGDASNSNLTLRDVTIYSNATATWASYNVAGGVVATAYNYSAGYDSVTGTWPVISTGRAENNTVRLEGKIYAPNTTIYGGMVSGYDATNANATAGNRLVVATTNATARDIANFEFVDFVIPHNVTNGSVFLTLTGSGLTDLSNTSVGYLFNTSATGATFFDLLNGNSSFSATLINKTNGTMSFGNKYYWNGTINGGETLTYNIGLNAASTSLLLNINKTVADTTNQTAHYDFINTTLNGTIVNKTILNSNVSGATITNSTISSSSVKNGSDEDKRFSYAPTNIQNSILTNSTINNSVVLNSNLVGGQLVGDSTFVRHFNETGVRVNTTIASAGDIGLDGVTLAHGNVTGETHQYTWSNGTHTTTNTFTAHYSASPRIVVAGSLGDVVANIELKNLTINGADEFIIASANKSATATITGSVNLQEYKRADGTYQQTDFVGAEVFGSYGIAHANITLANSNVGYDFYGARAINGNASANVVFSGNVKGTFNGADAQIDNNTDSFIGGRYVANAQANVTFSGTLGGESHYAYIDENGTLQNHTYFVDGRIVAASSYGGNASNSNLTLRDVTIYANSSRGYSNVSVGEISNYETWSGENYTIRQTLSSGAAENNTLRLEGAIYAPNSTFYGGTAFGSGELIDGVFVHNAQNVTLGNRLVVATTNASARDIANFEFVDFLIPHNATNGATLLTLTGTGKTDLSGVKFGVGALTGGASNATFLDALAINSSFGATLINKANGTLVVATDYKNATILNGLERYAYDIALNAANTSLSFNITKSGSAINQTNQTNGTGGSTTNQTTPSNSTSGANNTTTPTAPNTFIDQTITSGSYSAGTMLRSNATNVTLAGFNVTHSRANNTTISNSRVTNSNLTASRVSNSDINGGIIQTSFVDNSAIQNASVSGSRITNSNALNSNFTASNFTLVADTARDVSVTGLAAINGSRFVGSNITIASTTNGSAAVSANLSGAEWAGSNVTIAHTQNGAANANVTGRVTAGNFIGAHSANGTAQANITLKNSNISGNFYGFIGAHSANGTAQANITLKNSNISGNFYGAYASGTAIANVVFSGNVTHNFTAARSSNAASANLTFSGVAGGELIVAYSDVSASNSNLTLKDATIAMDVIGGYSSNGAAQNTITLLGAVKVGEMIYGGESLVSSTNATAGNRLVVATTNATALDVKNFEFYDFVINNQTASAGAAFLTLTGTGETDLSAAQISAIGADTLLSNASTTNATLTLINKSAGTLKVGELRGSSVLNGTARYSYDFALGADNASLALNVTKSVAGGANAQVYVDNGTAEVTNQDLKNSTLKDKVVSGGSLANSTVTGGSLTNTLLANVSVSGASVVLAQESTRDAVVTSLALNGTKLENSVVTLANSSGGAASAGSLTGGDTAGSGGSGSGAGGAGESGAPAGALDLTGVVLTGSDIIAAATTAAEQTATANVYSANTTAKSFTGATADGAGAAVARVSLLNSTLTDDFVGAASAGGAAAASVVFGGASASVGGDVIAARANAGSAGSSGASSAGSASNSNLTLLGGQISGDIYGGWVQNASAASGSGATSSAAGFAVNNTIRIEAALNAPNSTIYGGRVTLASGAGGISTATTTAATTTDITAAANVVSNNRLQLAVTNNIAQDVKNFEFIDIDIPANVADGETFLTLTGTGETDLTAVKEFSLSALTQNGSTFADLLQQPINVTYIAKPNGTLKLAGNYSVTARGDIATIYTANFAPSTDGKSLGGTLSGRVNDEQKALLEASLAGVSVVAAGQSVVDDFVRGTLNSNLGANPTANDVIGGTLTHGSFKTTTGSFIKTKHTSFAVGVARGVSEEFGYGAFVEVGYGSFDTHNELSSGAALNGDGTTKNFGIGAFASLAFGGERENSVQFSARVGQVKSDFEAGTAVQKYDTSRIYVGVGAELSRELAVWSAGGGVGVRGYLGAAWARVGGDDADVGSVGYEFDAAQSFKARAGARLTQVWDARWSGFVDAGYEYEFAGSADAHNKNHGYDVSEHFAEPSMKGGSGVAAAGVSFDASGAANSAGSANSAGGFVVNVKIKGSVGKTRGIGGGADVRYKF